MIRSGRALSHNWCEFFVPRLEDRSVPIVVAQSPFPFFWLLMASKLLFVEEKRDRVSIGWGTADRHFLQGEEVVSVEWDKPGSGDVTMQITSFSKPRGLLAWVAMPYVVLMQRKFVRDSLRKTSNLCRST
mmetsp:Transcript_41894/g.164216  ORF Transcript_41894/g.164216 Transcript_41894/m.164216 type:complete len:130 (-) Transcript_41894:953-1342(-)